MASLESLEAENSQFMAMFVGEHHSGKTVAECSFPHPIKVYDFDKRIKGILGAKWIEKKGIDVVQILPKVGKNSTLKSAFDRINDELEALLIMTQTGQCPYKTLVMDSLTSQTFSLVADALPMTHTGQNQDGKNRGRTIGGMRIAGPDDYNYESNGTQQIMAFLRSLPIPNIIVSAHVIPVFGKEDPDNPMSNTVVTGETLAVRPKIGATVPIYFDHIFRFRRRMNGNQERFYVEFRGNTANTSWNELPTGEVDITGKDFYNQVLMPYVRKAESATVSK